MDALDRMHQHLVATITAQHPQYLERPFEVSELHQTILPYRHHRRALGLDTNDEYEQVLTELLSGARGYLQVDDRMRETLLRELASPNPDPGAFRKFGSALVALAPRGAGAGAADRPTTSEPTGAAAPGASAPGASAPGASAPGASAPGASGAGSPVQPPEPVSRGGGPGALEQSGGAAAPAHTSAGTSGGIPGASACRFCESPLPDGREITFCPHCGQNLRVVGCDGCGAELEPGWRYCIACGRHTGR
jgi:hypothetical protein